MYAFVRCSGDLLQILEEVAYQNCFLQNVRSPVIEETLSVHHNIVMLMHNGI